MEMPGDDYDYDYDYDMPTNPQTPNWWDLLPGYDYDMPTNPQTPNWWDLLPGNDPIGDYLRTGGVEGSIRGGGTGGGAGSVGGPGSGAETFLRNITGTLGRYFGRGKGGGAPGAAQSGGLSAGQGLMALLAAVGSARGRQRPSGGGVGHAYAGPKQFTRTVEQGAYGPIARYAANGGVMRAYAEGGAVKPFPMQDGAFVMTKRAMDGAGGEQGIKRILPELVPIRGPGHGTSDSIPAYIQGKHGRTPAAVSNGEGYVPPGRDTKGLYALMKTLERKA